MCSKTFSVLVVISIIAFAKLSAAETSLGTFTESSDTTSESNETPYQTAFAGPETIPEHISKPHRKIGSARKVILPKYGMVSKGKWSSFKYKPKRRTPPRRPRPINTQSIDTVKIQPPQSKPSPMNRRPKTIDQMESFDQSLLDRMLEQRMSSDEEESEW